MTVVAPFSNNTVVVALLLTTVGMSATLSAPTCDETTLMVRLILLSGVICGVTTSVMPVVICWRLLPVDAPEGEAVPVPARGSPPGAPVAPAPVEVPDAMVTLPAVRT